MKRAYAAVAETATRGAATNPFKNCLRVIWNFGTAKFYITPYPHLDNLRVPTRIGFRLIPARRCGLVAEGGGLLNR